MTAEIVGPVPTVTCWGGTRFDDPNPPKVAYAPPANTLDPRYDACTEHRVACDCREAEHAEYRSEAQADRAHTEEAFIAALLGHPTYDDAGAPGCMCTGCQIARAAHMPYWKWSA